MRHLDLITRAFVVLSLAGLFVYFQTNRTQAQELPPPYVTIEESILAMSTTGDTYYVILPESRVVIMGPTPTPTPLPTPAKEYQRARLSHYDPSLGPPSCHKDNWTGGQCHSRINNFKDHWSQWWNLGVACPLEYPIGTVFLIPHYGKRVCVDRGGAINRLPHDGTIYLDLMQADYPYIPGGETIRDKYSPSSAYVVTVEVRR